MEDKTILKIKKLMALSESSNEYEARLAMLKAQELLMKYKLSLKEIEEWQNVDINVIENETTITFTKAKWKGRLANLIAENFGCYCFCRTKGTNTIVFMGKDEDVTVCTIVLEYAINCINSEVKRLRYEYLRDGYSTKGIENDYALGFIKGLDIAFEKQKESNQEWGLVLMKDQAVIDKYNNKNFVENININSKFQGFGDAYYQGIEDGKGFSITDRIAGEKEEGSRVNNKLGAYLKKYKYYCNNSKLEDYLNYEIEKIKEDRGYKQIYLKGTKVKWIIKKMSDITAEKYKAQYKIIKG